MSATFAALAVRDYRRYLLAQLGSGIGFWMQRLAQDWLILTLTDGSGVAVGIATALQFIPFLLVTPWAGVLADRLSRKTLMVTAHAGLVTSAIALLVLVLTDHASVPVLYVMAVLTGAMAALEQPARQAALGDIVGQDRIVNAVALNSVAFNISRIAGPAIAGLLIAGAGIAVVFGAVAAVFATALAALASLTAMPREDDGAGPRPTLRQGIAFVRARPTIVFALGMLFVIATFGLNFQLTTGLMSTVEFGGNAASFGLLSTFLALGSLVGSLLAARRTRGRLRLIVGSALAFSAATVLAGLMPTWTLFAIALPLCGITAMTFTTALQSFVQLATPAHMRGRVMGLYAMLFFAGTPIGAPLIGWLSDLFGPRIGLVGGGALSALGTLALALWLHRRNRAGHSSRTIQAR